MDSGCDVYLAKDRCWIAKNSGKELDVILSNGVFFVATKPSKLLSRKRSALELTSMSQAEIERARSTRVHARFGVPDPAARDTLDGDGPSVRIQNSHGSRDTLSCRELHNASGHAPYHTAARAADEPHLRKHQPETDEAVSRIEFDLAELERKEDQTLSTSSLNAIDDGSESSSATLCFTKALSEYLAETTLALEVLGHNAMVLHSDQELELVQLLNTVQNRRPIETSVRHGPRISHRSQSKIENVNQVLTTLENLLREKPSNDSILFAWLIRRAACSLTKFQLKIDGRTALLRVSGKAFTSQLPFGERVMYEHTAVPTDNLNQRCGHGIWIVEAPMTDEYIILKENGIQKAKLLHHVTLKEKF